MSTARPALSLSGIRVLLTRPAESAGPWRAALAQAGATVIDFPTIVVGPPPSWAPLEAALAQLPTYDWLVFTSANAARAVAERWPATAARGNQAKPQIAAVGGETEKALLLLGFSVARVPHDQRQEGLLAEFADLPAGARVLLPRALEGRDLLVDVLKARGITVDLVPVYETRAIHPLPPLPAFDVALFASPSALRAFVSSLGMAALTGRVCLVIGATTATAAAAFGLVPVVAGAPRVEAVIEAIAAHPQFAGASSPRGGP